MYDPQAAMDDAEPHLKVTDRRHFTAEGDLREEAPAESSRPEPPSSDAAGEVTPPDGKPDGRPLSEGAAAGPVTLASFLISLAAQAAQLLGGEERDLGGARQVISALEMLKDKTEGRRTEEESKILEALLFDLRLAFVEAAKGSGR